MESTNDILLKIIEKTSQLYPDSTTKKALINAKNLYKRVFSAFTLDQLLSSTTYNEIIDFCGNIPARLEFIHSLLEIYDKGDETFRNEASSLVKRSKTAMKMTKELLEQGYKIHMGSSINRLVYDIVLINPHNIFEEFERVFESETRGNKEYARQSINYYLKTHPGLKLFNDLFDEKYEQIKWDEKWSKSSPFRKEIYEQIVKWVERRTQTTSSKPEVASRAAIARYTHTLRLLSNYINNNLNPPTGGVDCLQWFFSFANIEQLNNALIYIVDNDITVKNELVRSENSAHSGTEFVYAFSSLTKHILVKYFTNKQDALSLNVNYILSSSSDKREQASHTERRHFLPSEIMKIEEYIMETQNSMWKLAFIILKEVGLRIYALTSLKIGHFINPNGCLVDSVTVLEKQRKRRTFIVSESMKKMLNEYFEEFPISKTDRERFIFRSQENYGKRSERYSPENISHLIKQFCNDAGVVGNFVHVHAFRHTLVNSLMSHGNKIENVSKYIGHSSVSTTEKYYWTDNVSNIIGTMNVPWLKLGDKKFAMPADLDDSEDEDDFEGDDSISDSAPGAFSSAGKCAQCDVLFHVLLTYHSELTDAQKLNIKSKIPNVEQIFDTFCAESLCSQSVASNDKSIRDFD
ncbi:MAG: site-specific integrase [Cetobacterium sp.]